MDEAVATLKEDGLSIGYEAREVPFSERDPKPRKSASLNWHRTAWHLEELLKALHARDRPRGVRTGFARRGAPGHPFVATGSRLWKRKPLDRSAALALVSKIIEENSETLPSIQLLLALGVRHLFMSVHPLPIERRRARS